MNIYASVSKLHAQNKNVSLLRFSILTLYISILSLVSEAEDSYPANEYEYAVRRDWMLEAEHNFHPHSQVLSKDEEIVDHYLHYLKWREHRRTRSTGFPPSRPIEEKLKEIQETDIYRVLQKLPKGGNMHSHENHEVSKSTLYDIIWESEDFQYLYLGNPENSTTAWKLEFFAIEPPMEGDPVPWLLAKEANYTKEQILEQQTLLGLLTPDDSRYPADSGTRWRVIDPLWNRMAGNLINNVNIKLKYMQAMYDHGISEGVTYFETRKNFGEYERLYSLNPDPKYQDTYGKVYRGENYQESSDQDVEMTRDFAFNYSLSHKDFIGHKRISYTYRGNPKEAWSEEMENVVRLYAKYPDHIIGFDTVGEEDAGYSHLHYLQNFLMMYNESTRQPRVPLFLHVVETNWPEDLISSDREDDPVATLNNLYEVLLLGSKRLGHATALIKHPYLMQVVRERNLAIEVCVVSNQILGFTGDLRNHPGIHYYRSGIPIIFGSDDPGTFGYDHFTVDWYEAYMAWGLTLADLKQIALNSLNYSAMTPAEKKSAIEEKWRPMWEGYIADMKAEACLRNYTDDGMRENRSISFARILPREGARIAGTRVHVFGRNFEIAICKEGLIQCSFGGKKSTEATYVTNEHIICVAPDSGITGGSLTVNLEISFDGENFLQTNFNYTFKYDVITTTIKPPPDTSGSSRSQSLLGNLLIFSVLLAVRLCY